MKQFEVEIMGQPYVLSCAEGDDQRFHAAVAQVDGTMNRIRDAGKVRARDRIAVLAALNLALELVDLADRPAAVASEVPEPAPAGHDAAALQDAARLQALLQRLDEALSQEGSAASPGSGAADGAGAIPAGPQDLAASADPAAPSDAAEPPADPAAPVRQDAQDPPQDVGASDADGAGDDQVSADTSAGAAQDGSAAGESIQNSQRPADTVPG